MPLSLKRIFDSSPGLVGQVGIVRESRVTQGELKYAIEVIRGKCSWYDEEQMEMVNPNPNRLEDVIAENERMKQ